MYSFISGKAVVVGTLVVLLGSEEITDEIDAAMNQFNKKVAVKE